MSNPSSVSQQATGSSTITLTPEERSLFGTLFRQYDTESLGIITGEAARSLFESSGLPPAILGEIWQLSDSDNKGFLDHIGFSGALRLIGHVQNGKRPNQASISTPGQLPRFKGVSLNPHLTGSLTGGASGSPKPPSVTQLQNQSPVPQLSASPVISTPTPTRPNPTGVLVPPLNVADRARFIQLFKNSAPHGILEGAKAKDIFLKAKLSNETLGQVWNLADIQRRGQLNQTEFTIAMHLIQCVLNGSLKSIPSVLPPSLYETAGEGDSNFAEKDTNQQPSSVNVNLHDINRQVTGPSAQSTSTWTISALEKSRYDSMFESIDRSHRGIIGAQEVVPFLTTSKLPEDILAQIWDLSDRHNTGEFTKTEFSIAMYLTQQKLAGRDLPATLPESLVSAASNISSLPPQSPSADILNDQPAFGIEKPPIKSTGSALNDLVSLNNLFTSPSPVSTIGSRDVSTALSVMTTGQNNLNYNSQTSGTRGGFIPTSNFGQNLKQQQKQTTGTPPVTQPQARFTTNVTTSSVSVPSPQIDQAPVSTTNTRNVPENDDLLLGNDSELSSKLSTATTEFANFSNQISSLTTQTTNLKAKRENSEAELANIVGRKQEIEGKLSQLRAIYDGEVAKVSQVEQLLAANRQETSQLSQEFSAMEAEYQSVLTQYQTVSAAYETDKQENLALKQQIAVTNAEITKLKEQLEVIKKEARQQRGFVAINQKQLAVLQTDAANISTEIETTKNEILEQKTLQLQLEQQILQQQTLQQQTQQEHALQQQTFQQQQEELQRQKQILEKEQQTLAQQQRELELEKQHQQQQLEQKQQQHLQQQEQHRQQQVQHQNQQKEQQQQQQQQQPKSMSIVAGEFDSFMPSSTAATTASSSRDGSRSPGNPFFDTVAPAVMPVVNGTERDFERAFESMGMGPATLSTGPEAFSLPIMRPQSASSSVQNNPPMSIRGDEEFSRSESPISAVSTESESVMSVPSVYNDDNTVSIDNTASGADSVDSDSESHHLGKSSGEFYAENYQEDSRVGTAKATSVNNDNDAQREKLRQASVATIKLNSTSSFSESDNGFQDIEEDTEPYNRDISDNESKVAENDIKGKGLIGKLELNTSLSHDKFDDSYQNTLLKSSGESSFEMVQAPDDYENDKEFNDIPMETETKPDEEVDTDARVDSEINSDEVDKETETFKQESDAKHRISQIPGGWVSSEVSEEKALPESADTVTEFHLRSENTDNKAQFDSIFNTLTMGSAIETHTSPHASFPTFADAQTSSKSIGGLDNEHFIKKFPSLDHGLKINDTNIATEDLDSQSEVKSRESNKTEADTKMTGLEQPAEDEASEYSSSSDEEGPEEIGGSKRLHKDFQGGDISDEGEEEEHTPKEIKNSTFEEQVDFPPNQSPFAIADKFVLSAATETVPQTAFEQDEFNSAFADLDEAKSESIERSDFEAFASVVNNDDGFDDFDTAFENIGSVPTEAGFNFYDSEPKSSSDDWEQIFAGFSNAPAPTNTEKETSDNHDVGDFNRASTASVTTETLVPSLPLTIPGTASYVNEFADAMRLAVSHQPEHHTNDTGAAISTGNAIHDKYIKELASLGFDAIKAQHALSLNDWNLAEASNWLLDNA
ncbi:hypothetical protein NADFUDRAFT_50228 [Nadsonia fulvescens var. elongata DSM 6958]|uniref:Uncharacterized protein n=1 Tax=Nadsonia fulvescens var. elongata DSM 6958 TaxID=857566 RepID=A0A1E3PLJ4_9ASCO|nr:hypothetical protein NADFUDRAFT_50228 [Nadsonia fulvescens var. elongata DSM 6958]